MKRGNVITTGIITVALISSGGIAHGAESPLVNAAPEPATPMLSEEVIERSAELFETKNVPASTRSSLLRGMREGKVPDSMSDAAPVSSTEQLVNGNIETTMLRGRSVSVTMLQVEPGEFDASSLGPLAEAHIESSIPAVAIPPKKNKGEVSPLETRISGCQFTPDRVTPLETTASLSDTMRRF
jgi:hypothetical protein